MKKIAVFPGTFDPFTVGHVDIVKRACLLFDEVVILFSENSNKQRTFSEFETIERVEKYFEDEPKVIVTFFDGLTVDFCKEIDANFIIRGVRSTSDYEYERKLAAMNKELAHSIETVIMFTRNDLEHISSSFVRELKKHNANYRKYII